MLISGCHCLTNNEVSFRGDENVLKLTGDDRCTTVNKQNIVELHTLNERIYGTRIMSQ